MENTPFPPQETLIRIHTHRHTHTPVVIYTNGVLRMDAKCIAWINSFSSQKEHFLIVTVIIFILYMSQFWLREIKKLTHHIANKTQPQAI